MFKDLNCLNKDLSVNQVVNFVLQVQSGIPENISLYELVSRCFNDSLLFDSWFNNLASMN